MIEFFVWGITDMGSRRPWRRNGWWGGGGGGLPILVEVSTETREVALEASALEADDG